MYKLHIPALFAAILLLQQSAAAEDARLNWHEDVFFGLHYDLHPNMNDTELGRLTTYEHIKEELLKVRPDFVQYDCKGHPGVTGYPTKIGTASPGIVNDALKIWREVTRDLGIPLSVHYSGIWDDAVLREHPEWARIGSDGKPSTQHCSPISGYTEEFMIPQLLEVIDNYDVDGFWIDGENWASHPDYSDAAKERFTKETGIQEYPAKPGEPHWCEWADFHRGLFVEHVAKIAEAVHKRKPACLVCSNWMYSVRQPDEVSVPVDYLSGDFSPSFGVERAMPEARFLDSRGKPWDLMAWSFFRTGDELWTMKTPAHLCQESAEVMANGGAVFIYNQPQRSGHLVGWHQDLFAEVARFCRARQPYCQYTKSVPQVALLHSQSHYYSHNRSLYDMAGANDPMEGALHALLECGYHVDILNDDALRERMNEYPLVVIPEQTGLPAELVKALESYVREGGRLLSTGAHIAADYGDFLGVEALEGERGLSYLPANGGVVTINGPWKNVKTTSAESIAPLYSQQELHADAADIPAATVRQFGKGRVAGIYGPVFHSFYKAHYPRLRAFIADVMQTLDRPELIRLEGPACVAMSVRERDDRLLVQLVNRSASPSLDPKRHGVEHVPPVGPLSIRIPCKAKPERVYLAPDVSGLTWSWRDGAVHARVDSLHIHNVLVLEME